MYCSSQLPGFVHSRTGDGSARLVDAEKRYAAQPQENSSAMATAAINVIFRVDNDPRMTYSFRFLLLAINCKLRK